MPLAYLATENSPLEQKIFPLEKRVIIGRGSQSDIHLKDLSVSRQHALVYFQDEEAIIKDLDSKNGTFINGQRVKLAIMSNGDIIRLGGVTCRFFLEETPQEPINLTDTQEITPQSISADQAKKTLSRRSPRLIQAISNVPLFASLDEKSLAQISQAAQLKVYDKGETIVRQGDRGRALHVILDGKVRVFTYDYEGSEFTLSFLSENQFFGEIAFLTGAPRPAMVQAVEETLICMVGFHAMHAILQKSPVIKGVIEQYYQNRIKDFAEKKQSAGFSDRRKHPRFNEELPVHVSLSPSCLVAKQLHGKDFCCNSIDISNSGTRIKVQDRSLLEVPLGAQLRLEICLPQPWESIRCLGTLRSIIEGNEGQDLIYMGIEFYELPTAMQERLDKFLYH